MAVSRYFGLPGCGKTTTLAMLAWSASKSGKYKNIYANVHLNIPGVTFVEFDVLGKYMLRDCLVLIDEAMVNCGDRDYKNFGKEKLKTFVEHRHANMDIVLFSQEPDGIDKKIRSITDRMYYVKKGLILGRWITTIYKIPYKLIWPSEKSGGENVGKILMGYVKPPFFSFLFAKRVIRARYYKYFDSWELDWNLPELPATYKPYAPPLHAKKVALPWVYKNTILLCSWKRWRRQKRQDGLPLFPIENKKKNGARKRRERNIPASGSRLSRANM